MPVGYCALRLFIPKAQQTIATIDTPAKTLLLIVSYIFETSHPLGKKIIFRTKSRRPPRQNQSGPALFALGSMRQNAIATAASAIVKIIFIPMGIALPNVRGKGRP